MNQVRAFLEAIPEAKLKAAVTEMANYEKSGILPDGVVRNLVEELVQVTHVRTTEARSIVDAGILRMAAYRLAGISA
jgi:DNA polymerase III gamma/tau subunit